MIVAKFSAGCSSFAACYLVRDKIDRIVYTHIDDQHPDTMRFLSDAEKLLGIEIEVIQSPLKSVDAACRAQSYIVGPAGARCTRDLKRKAGDRWIYENDDDDMCFVWGLDKHENNRADRLANESMNAYKHLFPLIDADMSKEDCHALCWKLGIERPAMYDMGYPNNNCIGCVKGGMGYWNKIRADFPEVYASRSKLERDIGAAILCQKGKEIFLDELEPHRGRTPQPIEVEECGLFCQMAAR